MTTADLYRTTLALPRQLGVYSGQTKEYDIVYFQSYDYQSSLYHKQHDLLSATSKYTIYIDKIIPEVSKIIKIFMDFYNNNINEKEFIKKTYHHIATTTFAVSTTALNNKSAFPKTGLSKTLKFRNITGYKRSIH